jgi:hypothetical protein
MRLAQHPWACRSPVLQHKPMHSDSDSESQIGSTSQAPQVCILPFERCLLLNDHALIHVQCGYSRQDQSFGEDSRLSHEICAHERACPGYRERMGKGTGKGGQQVESEALPFSRPKSLQNLKHIGKISLDEVKKHRELCVRDQSVLDEHWLHQWFRSDPCARYCTARSAVTSMSVQIA